MHLIHSLPARLTTGVFLLVLVQRGFSADALQRHDLGRTDRLSSAKQVPQGFSVQWSGVLQQMPLVAQQAYLKASNSGLGDKFGWSASVSGDTVVVGAHQEDSNATGVNGNAINNNATNSGAAYVFVREGMNWNQQAYLKASNTEGARPGVDNTFGDEFGRAVSISGNTIVIGAPGEDSIAMGVNGNQADNSANNSGAAYVFVRDGTNWSQQGYLKASNTGANDAFGISVAVAGDTVIVGARGEASRAAGVT